METLNQQKSIVDTIRTCQRNWDLTKSIPKEYIDHWVYIATHSPSKQDEAYYDLYVITDKNLIETLYDHTWGYTISVVDNLLGGVVRNPQMAANAYFLWVEKTPKTMKNYNADGTPRDSSYPGRKDNALMAIGIAMGLVAYSAGSLGYKTGFNKNHGQTDTNSNQVWKDILGIPEDHSIAYGLGIGVPMQGRDRNEHDETEFLAGVAPSKRYNILTDTHVEFEGEKYPIPEIYYVKESTEEKDIQVFYR